MYRLPPKRAIQSPCQHLVPPKTGLLVSCSSLQCSEQRHSDMAAAYGLLWAFARLTRAAGVGWRRIRHRHFPRAALLADPPPQGWIEQNRAAKRRSTNQPHARYPRNGWLGNKRHSRRARSGRLAGCLPPTQDVISARCPRVAAPDRYRSVQLEQMTLRTHHTPVSIKSRFRAT